MRIRKFFYFCMRMREFSSKRILIGKNTCTEKSCCTVTINIFSIMMKTFNVWIFAVCSIVILLFNGCRVLQTPVIVKNAPIERYKYVYITPTKDLTSSSGTTYGGQYVYGTTTTKSVNPSDVISGELIKKGFIILPELKPELNAETLIVSYGESGRRNRGLGYAIEVTIQFISAESYEMVCTCTAEGQGYTEADDIRQAIRRALAGL